MTGNTKKALTIESIFLQDLFDQLNKSGARYAVLRNYESLPNSLGGSDLDLLFSSKCFSDANIIIFEIAHKHGLKCIATIRADRVLTRIFLGSSSGLWWGVRFDTFSYVGTNGCDILPAEHVLKRAIIHNGIRVASSSDASIMSFLKDIIGAGSDRKQYQRGASLSFKLEKHAFEPILDRYFGNTCVHSTIIPLLENKTIDLRHAQKVIKRSWLFTNAKANFKRTVISRFVDYRQRFKRLFRPPGISVAFLGTDGSGKSTIINEVRPILVAAMHCRSHYEHLRPNFIPSIGRLFGKPAIIGPVTNPHASTPSGMVGSICRILYYSVDYILGYWVKVHPRIAKRPCVFFFDRYFYDYLYDPHRSRINLPDWIINFISLFIPKPDIIFCLGTRPEIIHARKPELSILELTHQLNILKLFYKKEKRTVWIDTSDSPKQSVHEVMTALTQHMEGRYK